MATRFDRFTERARRALNIAAEEAQKLHQNYIGTEHLLLGLVEQQDGLAARVLTGLGVDLAQVRSEAELRAKERGEGEPNGEIGLDVRAKKAIELSVDEARQLNHHYIGTEHLLLGVLREDEGIAAGVLGRAGLDVDRVRTATAIALGQVNQPLFEDSPDPASGVVSVGAAGLHPSDRFDKFTERARRALHIAQEEAQRLKHNYIGTEHILLGLVAEGNGVAAKVLANLGVELDKVRTAVEFIIGRGDRAVLGEIGLTPRAKKVIELSIDEARRRRHRYVGTEHLLLGLVREGEGIAAGVLESLGADLESVRAETTRILSANLTPTSSPPRPNEGAERSLRPERLRSRPTLESLRVALHALSEAKNSAIAEQKYELAAELRDFELRLIEHMARLERDTDA